LNERIYESIDLSDLIEAEQLKTVESLAESIDKYQARIVAQLVEPEGGWQRAASSYTRILVTKLGKLKIRVIKLRNKFTGEIRSPILDALQIRRKKYSLDVRIILADMAARLSYDDSRKQFMEITGVEIPKRTIHSFVQEIGSKLKDQQREEHTSLSAETEGESPMIAVPVLADGTKTHSIYETNNDVKVAMKYDQSSGEKRLISIGVNNGWDDAKGKTYRENTIIISDAEEEIPQSIAHSDVQLDLVHAVRDSLFRMWMDGSSKEERDKLSKEMNRILYTLVNSVKKHLEDHDRKRLSKRIESTIEELSKLAKKMERRGCLKTSIFIKSHSRLMVTFAKIALTKGIMIPYTSNAIERLMGEISKRCKHKWMHWSTRGLENILWILLVRYTDPAYYHERFWNDYIHPSTHRMMHST
jgi:hypothetical protein